MMPAEPPGPLQTLTAEASSARREGQAVAAERAQQSEIRNRRFIARLGDLEPEIHHHTPTVPPEIPAKQSKSIKEFKPGIHGSLNNPNTCGTILLIVESAVRNSNDAAVNIFENPFPQTLLIVVKHFKPHKRLLRAELSMRACERQKACPVVRD